MKEQDRRSKNFLNICILIGFLIGLLVEFAITSYDFCHGRWQEGSVLEAASLIEEGTLELKGGVTLEESNLISRESEASLIFHGTENWGRMELEFGEPLKNDTQLEWLYALENQGFDRFQRQEGFLVAGSDKAVISVPDKKRGKLELDIHGGFFLKEIRVSERVNFSEFTILEFLKDLNWIRLFIMTLCFGLGIWLYVDERRKRKQAEKSLTVSKQEKDRYVYLDAIRCLAAVMVIVVHVVEPLNRICPFGSLRYILVNVTTAVCLCCNILFLMISAALLLPWKEESWGTFLKKRFLRVFIPLAVYGMLYLKVCCISQAGIGLWIPYIIRIWCTGDFIKGPHLWLVYALLRLYVTVIPLRFMLKSMGEHSQKALTVLILGCLAVKTFGAWTGINFGQPMIFGEWTGVFVMGYLVNQKWMRDYDRLLCLGGLISFIISVYIVITRLDCFSIIPNQSILAVLMALAMYVILLRMDGILKPVGKWLAIGSKYSYSVLLVHWFVLIRMVYNGWFHSGMNEYLQILLPVMFCGVVSVILSWLIDHGVVDVIMGFKKVHKELEKK